jgi:hypothetical protein
MRYDLSTISLFSGNRIAPHEDGNVRGWIGSVQPQLADAAEAIEC